MQTPSPSTDRDWSGCHVNITTHLFYGAIVEVKTRKMVIDLGAQFVFYSQ